MGFWQLESPRPVSSIELRQELAFGGVKESRGRFHAFEENPFGRGYSTDCVDGVLPAPQIESLEDPIGRPGKSYAPQVLGPLAPVCLSRREKAGTFDKDWEESKWPLMPDDFDYGFFNSADGDLVADPYLIGDEPCELKGLLPAARVATRLPGIRPFVIARQRSGAILPHAAPLDTVVFDLDRAIVNLTWRACVSLQPPVRVLECRAVMPSELTHG